jgi:DNA-binding transcriptional MocR family regulator
MTVRLARRMEILKASDIREILKVTQRPEVISFAGGLPAPELFPTERLAGLAASILREEGWKALQYSTTEGHPRLREQIAGRGDALWGTVTSPDEVLVTTGSQQGLDLIGKLFLDDGDTVLCEGPTYLGAISAWNVFRPRWVEVPTDDDGMDILALESLLDRHPEARLIYVVPNFQNPSGRTWSIERRRRFMEVVNRRGVPVVEDNPYGELRFEGVSLPALKSLDERGTVLTLGTYSKTFCPGLRLAWLTACRALHQKLVILKQGADLHTATFNQILVSRYLDTYDMDEDVRRIVEVYRGRRGAMVESLEREMPDGISFTRPAGGLFLWVELPPDVNARELLRRCVERDLAFVPGGAFFPNGGHENTLRLNFSNMPEARIMAGVRRLGSILREVMEEGVTSRAALG